MSFTRRRAPRIVALAGLLSVFLLSSSALAHDIIYFDDHTVTVREGLQRNIRIERCCHGTGSASFDWETQAGTAQPGTDVVEESGTENFSGPIAERDLTFKTANDGAVEPLMVGHMELSNPKGSPAPIITFPKVADVVIIDEDGPSRVAFMLPDYSVYSNRESVKLDVVRLGSVTVAETVSYATADGTAIHGEHYRAKSGTVEIPAGEREATTSISIPILDNSGETDNTEFTVRLRDGTPDPTAGPQVVTVEIRNLQTGDFAKPFTDFHRPRDGATYGPGSFFTKEAHVFFDDGGGSGVKTVALALAKKMKSGGCRWWDGRRYRASSCKLGKAQDRVGIWAMKKHPKLQSGDFKIFRYPHKLKPTQGSKVRAYRVVSRATDFSANVESKFTKGFNIRTFKVRR